jgi:protein-S-isoprenylcysteine O-methyltransferase Ste14
VRPTGRPSPSDVTSATRQPGRPSAPTGAAVRFPFPPALFAVPLAAALVAERKVARLPLPGAGSNPLTRAGFAVGAAGMALGAFGVAAVLRQGTTVVPHRPVTRLVTGGPYRVSRNPMYAGQAVALVGAGLATGSWWPLAAAAVGMFATTRLVIEPEEDYLAVRFGDEYARYRSRVRRWL